MKAAIEATKPRVERALEQNNEARDNDKLLTALLWSQDLKDQGLQGSVISADNLLALFARGKLTNPESIRRSRQKLQEENPGLRGKRYKQRHDSAEEVRGMFSQEQGRKRLDDLYAKGSIPQQDGPGPERGLKQAKLFDL